MLDPTVFIDQHCFIRHKSGKTAPFNLWPEQREVIECFDDEMRTLVLKARQLGISWCSDGFALWLCTANVGQTVIILSKGQREASEELVRVRFMHSKLPPELRRELGEPNTTTRMEFPEMDSRIISLPSTDDAGTSLTATLVIIQELAKIENAASLMGAITPTMADDGRLIVVSTAKGYSGVFFDYWREVQHRWHGATIGDPGEPGAFRPVFIPWHARPGRSAAWYAATSKTLPAKTMRQEYPASPTEAFQGSADSVFAEEFDRNIHGLDSTRNPRSDFPVVDGIDPGLNHGLAYLIEVQRNQAFVFAEIHLENQTVEELAAAVVEAHTLHGIGPGEVVSYVDAFNVGRDMQTGRTDNDVMREAGLHIDSDGDRVVPAERVNLIKLLLKQHRLWVSLDCPDLLDALERAPWKTRRVAGGERVREETYEKDGHHEHPLDALGAALIRIFTPMVAAAAETEVAAVATGGYDY